jgi:hypothetical protein
VIDQGGLIRFLYVGSTQFDRAPLADVLTALEQAK